MQLTIFGDDANRAALSTNGFASKEPALLCPFQKKKKKDGATEKQYPEDMARYNCTALSVYVSRTSTPRELETFWRRQECHSEMIPQGLALHSSPAYILPGQRKPLRLHLRAPPATASRSFTFYLHRREDRFISEGGGGK